MNTSPYRLLRFEGPDQRVVCVPWPQLLACRWSAAGAEDQIEFCFSVGTIHVRGPRLEGLWSAVVSLQADRFAVGPRETGSAIRSIEFALAGPER